jgi:hypothetical protein
LYEQIVPGLLLRNVVAARMDVWQAAVIGSEWVPGFCTAARDYAIRVYIGTKRGTFVKFPGAEMSASYDPYVLICLFAVMKVMNPRSAVVCGCTHLKAWLTLRVHSGLLSLAYGPRRA